MSKVLGIVVLALLLSAQVAQACTVVTVYRYQKVPSALTVIFYRDGVPVRNSKAMLYLQKDDRPPLLLRSYSTDAEGQVALSGLQTGHYLLSVTGDNREQTVALEVVPESKGLPTQVIDRFSTPPPPKLRDPIPVRQLQGVVLDPQGAVLPGVKIHVAPEADTKFSETNVVSDGAGRFLTVAPEGHYLLTLESTYFEKVTVPVEVTGEARAWDGVAVTLLLPACGSPPNPNFYRAAEMEKAGRK